MIGNNRRKIIGKNEEVYGMTIITINIPKSYLKAMEPLLTNRSDPTKRGQYPSRSECIRVAVRDFLMKEITFAKEIDIIETETEVEKLRRLVYG